MSLIYIIADDLTGAADSAARCRHAGLSATICVTPPASPHAWPTGDVIALSSDSRFLPPTIAAQQVQRLLQSLSSSHNEGGAYHKWGEAPARPIDAGCSSPRTWDAPDEGLWYKKIDSTLRGNLGSEIAAMLPMVTPPDITPCALISPAFPAQGRGLVDGALVYDQRVGPPIHLPTLLQQQCNLPVAAVDLATVRAGPTALAVAFKGLHDSGNQLIVVDALQEEDLATLYAAARSAIPTALFCGSAGLIGVIGATLAAAQQQGQAAASAPIRVAPPLLAIVGSGSGMAQRQLAALQAMTGVHHHLVTLAPIDGSDASFVQSALVWPSAAPLVLHLPTPTSQAMLEGEAARAFAAALADTALAAIGQRTPATLLLVGGDTAIHVLQRLGITSLTVLAEVLPGMPITQGQAADGRTYTVILKAGNHGDEQTLVQLCGLVQ